MSLAGGSLRYVLAAVLAAAVAAPLSYVASGACLVAGVGVAYFHRDPARHTPPRGVVAPADGTVTVIREEGDRVRVGIYMSGWDVHVNRAPMDGVVTAVEHVPGANRLAFTKESERNERRRYEFGDYAVEQVAGAFARRTHPYVEPGDEVGRGQRIGHISFGSRFDLVLPPAYDPGDLTVDVGHRLHAGETVVAPDASVLAAADTTGERAGAAADDPDADEETGDQSRSTTVATP